MPRADDLLELPSRPGRPLTGTARVPGDKALAHRTLILGALARGETLVRGLPAGHDVDATCRCLEALGVSLERCEDAARIRGLGTRRLAVPAAPLDCGASASTLRMVAGAVAGRGGITTFTGDESLRRRPMDRLAEVLVRTGARVTWGEHEGCAPFTVEPAASPRAGTCELQVPSAQVKTAAILAALGARGRTEIIGRIDSRDHTERLLPRMGGRLVVLPDRIAVEGGGLEGIARSLPGDPSAAAFLVGAAVLIPGSRIRVPRVLVNPTRTGFLEALRWMGADVRILGEEDAEGEPVADLEIRHAELRGVEVPAAAVPFLVDEIPVLAVLATQAAGVTVIQGAGEARLKESDRLTAMVEELGKMGASLAVEGDALVVEGPTPLHGAALGARDDHRVAMALTVAARVARGRSSLAGWAAVEKSWPGFFQALEGLEG